MHEKEVPCIRRVPFFVVYHAKESETQEKKKCDCIFGSTIRARSATELVFSVTLNEYLIVNDFILERRRKGEI